MLELYRTNVLRDQNINQNGLSFLQSDNNNKNKIFQLTNVGKNKLSEAIVIWEEFEYNISKL